MADPFQVSPSIGQPADPFSPAEPLAGLRMVTPSGLAQMGTALVNATAPRMEPLVAPRSTSSIAYSPSRKELFVNGLQFAADDDAKLLESEQYAAAPGTGLPQGGDWVPLDQDSYSQLIQSVRQPTLGRLMSKNFGRGIDFLQLLVGRGLQFAGAEETGGRIVEQQMEDLRRTQPYERQFTDIESGNDAIEWLAANFAQQGPNLIETVVTGTLGALAGGAAAGPLAAPGAALAGLVGKAKFKSDVKAVLAKKVAGESISGPEQKLLREAAAIAGATAASYASGQLMGLADIYGEMREQGVSPEDFNARMLALAGSIPYGALEVLTEYAFASRLLGAGGRPALPAGTSLGRRAGEYGRRAATGLALGGTAEGVTELGQESIVMGFSGQDLTSPEATNRFINAFAAGFGIGGPLGAASYLRSRTPEQQAGTQAENLLDSTRPPEPPVGGQYELLGGNFAPQAGPPAPSSETVFGAQRQEAETIQERQELLDQRTRLAGFIANAQQELQGMASGAMTLDQTRIGVLQSNVVQARQMLEQINSRLLSINVLPRGDEAEILRLQRMRLSDIIQNTQNELAALGAVGPQAPTPTDFVGPLPEVGGNAARVAQLQATLTQAQQEAARLDAQGANTDLLARGGSLFETGRYGGLPGQLGLFTDVPPPPFVGPPYPIPPDPNEPFVGPPVLVDKAFVGPPARDEFVPTRTRASPRRNVASAPFVGPLLPLDPSFVGPPAPGEMVTPPAPTPAAPPPFVGPPAPLDESFVGPPAPGEMVTPPAITENTNFLTPGLFVYHAVRNDSDVQNIVENGASPGTNVSFDTDGQAFSGEGDTILVFRRNEAAPEEKGYQPDGVITTAVRPVAILKDTGLESGQQTRADIQKEINSLIDQFYEAVKDIAQRSGLRPSAITKYLGDGDQKSPRAVVSKLIPFQSELKALSPYLAQINKLYDQLDKAPEKALSVDEVLARYRKYNLPVRAITIEAGEFGFDSPVVTQLPVAPEGKEKLRRGRKRTAQEATPAAPPPFVGPPVLLDQSFVGPPAPGEILTPPLKRGRKRAVQEPSPTPVPPSQQPGTGAEVGGGVPTEKPVAGKGEALKRKRKAKGKKQEQPVPPTGQTVAPPTEPPPTEEPINAGDLFPQGEIADKDLMAVLESTGLRLAWTNGVVALIQHKNVFGGPIYVGYKNGRLTNVEIDAYKGDLFSPDEIALLNRAFKAITDFVSEQEKLAPDGPLTGKGNFFATENVDPKIAEVVRGWLKLLGLENKKVLIATAADAFALSNQTYGKYSLALRLLSAPQEGNTSGVAFTYKANDSVFIIFRPQRSVLKTLELLSHEVGHSLQRFTFDDAPQELQDKIKAEYDKWRAANELKPLKELIPNLRALRTSRRFLQATPPEVLKVPPSQVKDGEAYYLGFKEWFADQVAKWATTQAKPLTVVEKFFKRLADKLKTFFTGIRAQYLPTTTMTEWLNSLSPEVVPPVSGIDPKIAASVSTTPTDKAPPTTAPTGEKGKTLKAKKELTREKAEELLDDLDLDPETTKAKVMALAKRMLAAGLIDDGDIKSLTIILKDRDMGPEDLISELRSTLAVTKGTTPPKKDEGGKPPTQEETLTPEESWEGMDTGVEWKDLPPEFQDKWNNSGRTQAEADAIAAEPEVMWEARKPDDAPSYADLVPAIRTRWRELVAERKATFKKAEELAPVASQTPLAEVTEEFQAAMAATDLRDFKDAISTVVNYAYVLGNDTNIVKAAEEARRLLRETEFTDVQQEVINAILVEGVNSRQEIFAFRDGNPEVWFDRAAKYGLLPRIRTVLKNIPDEIAFQYVQNNQLQLSNLPASTAKRYKAKYPPTDPQLEQGTETLADSTTDNDALRLANLIKEINTKTVPSNPKTQARYIKRLKDLFAKVQALGKESFVDANGVELSEYFDVDGVPITGTVGGNFRVATKPITEEERKKREQRIAEDNVDLEDIYEAPFTLDSFNVRSVDDTSSDYKVKSDGDIPAVTEDEEGGTTELRGLDKDGRFMTEDGKPIKGPLALGRLQLALKGFLSKLAIKPKVRVFRNQEDFRQRDPELYAQAVASRPQGDFDTANAVGYSFGNGNVIIFSDRVITEKQLRFVLAHETLGHFGFRGLLNHDQLNAALDRIYESSPKVRAAADVAVKSRGLSRREATEEYLADFAGVLDTNIIARFWNSIKNGLNKLGVRFEDDLARYFVSQSRRYVRNGSVKFTTNTKVVDTNGKPLMVYHGSGMDITEFKSMYDQYLTTNESAPWDQAGIYFTEDFNLANTYARKRSDLSPTVYPVYLDIKNPFDITEYSVFEGWKGRLAKTIAPRLAAKEENWNLLRRQTNQSLITPANRERLEKEGFDGIKAFNNVWIAFRPDQVKFAFTNNGVIFSASEFAKRFQAIEGMNDPDGSGRFSLASDSFSGANRIAAEQAFGRRSLRLYEGTAILQRVKDAGINLRDVYNRVIGELQTMNFSSRENLGSRELYSIFSDTSRTAAQHRNQYNAMMKTVLSPAMEIAGMRLGGGVRREEIDRTSQMLMITSRVKGSISDTTLRNLPSLLSFTDGVARINEVAFNQLSEMGRLKLEDFQRGFEYTVDDPRKMDDAEKRRLEAERDAEVAATEGDTAKEGVKRKYKRLIDAPSYVVKVPKQYPATPSLTATSPEWVMYNEVRDTMDRAAADLLLANFAAIEGARDNVVRIARQFLGRDLAAEDEAFVKRVADRFLELRQEGATFSRDGGLRVREESANRANDFMEKFNAALIGRDTDRNDAVKEFFEGAEADDIPNKIEALKAGSSIIRTEENKYTLQQAIQGLALVELNRGNAELFAKQTIAGGYTPYGREGQWQIRMQAVDPTSGRVYKVSELYRQNLFFAQVDTKADALAIAEAVQSSLDQTVQRGRDGDPTTYELEVLDGTEYKIKKVKLVAQVETARQTVTAVAQTNLNEVLNTLLRFSINITPAERERLIVNLTNQDASARRRLRRSYTPGVDPNAIKYVSQHLESIAAIIARKKNRFRLDRLFDEGNRESQELWRGSQVEYDRRKAAWEAAQNDPTLSDKQRLAIKREFDDYHFVYVVGNPKENANRYIDRGRRLVAFMEAQTDVDHTDFASGDAASFFRTLTTMVFMGLSPATAVLNYFAFATNVLPALAGYNEKNAFGGGFGWNQSSVQLTRAISDTKNRKQSYIEYWDNLLSDPEALRKSGFSKAEALFMQKEVGGGKMNAALTNSMLGTARGRFTSGTAKRSAEAIMGMFNYTEQHSRRATGLTAFRLAYDRAIAEGKDEATAFDVADRFAVEMIDNTLGEYGMYNRPAMFRGDVRQFIFMFKMFPVNTVQMLAALPRKELLIALAILAMFSGLKGLPFADDLMDIIDTIAQALGLGPSKIWRGSAERTLAEFLDAVAPGMTPLMMRGLLNAVLPANFADRLSVSNIIPGTGIALAGADVGRELVEVFGPVASFAQGALAMIPNAVRFGITQPLGISPDTVTLNSLMRDSPVTMLRAMGDMVAYTNAGAIVNRQGYVASTDLHAGVLLFRALGFYPAAATAQNDVIRVAKRIGDYQKDTVATFRGMAVSASLAKDTQKLNEVKQMVREWNEAAKGTGLEIRNFNLSVSRALREARLSATERFQRTQPISSRADTERLMELYGLTEE